jgi:hypothetical protein
VPLVQNNLATTAAGYENEGRTLHHGFVVRQWLPAKPVGGDDSDQTGLTSQGASHVASK